MLARISDRMSSKKTKVRKIKTTLWIIYSFMLLGSVALLFVIEKDEGYIREIWLSLINVAATGSLVAIHVIAVIIVPHCYLFNILLLLTFVGNLITTLAPLTGSGLKEPIPVYIITGCSVLGILAPCFMAYNNDLEHRFSCSSNNSRFSSKFGGALELSIDDLNSDQ